MSRQDEAFIFAEFKARLGQDFIPKAVASLGLKVGSVSCPVPGHPRDGIDTTPSFQIFPHGGARCYANDHFKAKDIIELVMAVKDFKNRAGAMLWLWSEIVEPLADARKIYNWRKRLTGEIAERLLKERFITKEAAKDLFLGWVNDRLALPIRNSVNYFVEVLQHDALKLCTAEGKKKQKSLPLLRARRLGIPALPFPSPIVGPLAVLCEGEPDACVLRSAGLPGYSYGAFSQYVSKATDIAQQTKGIGVVWIPDADEDGEKATTALVGLIPGIKVLRLPSAKDTTKYIESQIAAGLTLDQAFEQLRKLVEAAPLFKPPIPDVALEEPDSVVEQTVTDSVQEISPPDEEAASEPEELSLDQALSASQVDKISTTYFRVAGTEATTHAFPCIVEVSCKKDQGAACSACPGRMPSFGCKKKFEIAMDSDANVKFLFDNRTGPDTVLQQTSGLPKVCDLKFNVLERRDVLSITGLNPATREATPLIRSMMSSQVLYPGKVYRAAGKTMVKPWSQEVLFALTEIHPESDWMDRIDFRPEEVLELAKTYRDIPPWERMVSSAERLARAVTRIVGRPDVHMLTELTLHSPLSFRFGADIVDRGWLDTLAIGDTQVGKGKTVERTFTFYNAGPTIAGENSSRAGIIGGIEMQFNRRHIVWGAWPLNDRKAVMIDEFPHPEVMADLTRPRSEGVAEIAKAGLLGSVPCRTRKVWLANPSPPNIQARTFKTMDSFTFGVEVMIERLKDAADVARFDVVCVCKRGEVPPEDINAPWRKAAPEDEGTARFRMAWIWTRKPEQVYFEPESIELVYKSTQALAKIYDPTVPLFTAEDGRYKLARIAAAIAGFCLSTPDGVSLVVKPEHVTAAARFIRVLYDKPACDYRGFSQFQRAARAIQVPERITACLANLDGAHRKAVALGILNSPTFTWREMEVWAGDYETGQALIHELLSQRAILDTSRWYERQPALIPFMHKILSNGRSY